MKKHGSKLGGKLVSLRIINAGCDRKRSQK
jgi:hypothetical protein